MEMDKGRWIGMSSWDFLLWFSMMSYPSIYLFDYMFLFYCLGVLFRNQIQGTWQPV